MKKFKHAKVPSSGPNKATLLFRRPLQRSWLSFTAPFSSSFFFSSSFLNMSSSLIHVQILCPSSFRLLFKFYSLSQRLPFFTLFFFSSPCFITTFSNFSPFLTNLPSRPTISEHTSLLADPLLFESPLIVDKFAFG